MTAIIDFGTGNLNSVIKLLKRTCDKIEIVYLPNEIKRADRIILPGVGHFNTAMLNLWNHGFIDALNHKILIERTPILGICLGMQLLTGFSEEGYVKGLGWINAETVRFRMRDIRYKIPHMGWNSLIEIKDSPLLKNISVEDQFYFVHSYHAKCNEKKDILATSEYGEEFVAVIQKDNIFGVQFHPEKSHKAGETILRNFLSL